MQPVVPGHPEHKRSKSLRRVGVVLIALLAAGALLYGLLRPAPSEDAGAAPDFNLALLSGTGRLSSDDLRGKPVVLNFWASWCEPCREETPLLQRTYEKYKDRGVVFVGVNSRDDPAEARAFVEKFGVTYPVVRDVNGDLVSALRLPGLPGTFFIDSDWRLLSSEQTERPTGTENVAPAGYLGGIDEAELTGALDRLLDSDEDPS